MSRRDGRGREGRLRRCRPLLLLPLLLAPGCFRGGRGIEGGPPPSPPATVRADAPDNASNSWIDLNPVVVRLAEPEADNAAVAVPAAPPPDVPGRIPPGAPAEAKVEPAVTDAAPPAAAEPSKETLPPEIGETPSAAHPVAKKPKPHPSTPPPPEAKGASPAAGPAWANGREELVYRVDFIGITMGYARFRYQGKVAVGGKVAYHLNVRAWTSGVLSYIYPVNETIDYYLDAETLAPLRQEFTQRAKLPDDVATYEQDTGKITYRYRRTGEVRKRVNAVPMVYDPVSAAYYFRWRDVGGDEKSRNVYAGRKVWQISARVLGKERIRTENGEMDTVVIRPVIRRDGKLEDKGDLKMWLSSDERRVPVRLYAKFRKIRDWTLVGELVPQREGG